MALRIWHKLFLVLLLATAVAVLVALALTRWSFNRGFLGYLNALETQRIETMATALAAEYRAAGGWDTIVSDPRLWDELMDSASLERQRRSGTRRPPPRGPNRDPAGPHGDPGGSPGPLGLRQPIDLLDADGGRVIGKRGPREGAVLHEIGADGQTIGYLRYVPLTELTQLDEEADQGFLVQQRRGAVWIALLALSVAAMLALFLARQLVAPLRALAAGARALADGRFEERIDVDRRDELGHLAEDFNSMAAKLEHNRSARRQWIVDISHELRTPLAVLTGELQAIEDGVRAWDQSRLTSLQSEVERLNALVGDLHELSLADAGAMSLEKRRVDFVEVIRGALTSCAGQIAAANLRIVTDLPDSALVQGDARRLEQLVLNLLQNSCRYTDQGGEIRVSCTLGETIRFTVEDSAPGVAAGQRPRLFDRLYRVDESRGRARGGSGLGLAIAKAIVEAHGGAVAAGGSGLGGLRVEVELPHDE